MTQGNGIPEAARPFIDKAFYEVEAQQVFASLEDAFSHYVSQGWRTGLNPSKLFDTRFYWAAYDDARKTKVCPLLHYLDLDLPEDRRVTPIRESDLSREAQFVCRSFFDARYYRKAANNHSSFNMTDLEHYLNIGWRRGFEPSKQFDTNAYRALPWGQSDLPVTTVCPLLHMADGGWTSLVRSIMSSALHHSMASKSASEDLSQFIESCSLQRQSAHHFDLYLETERIVTNEVVSTTLPGQIQVPPRYPTTAGLDKVGLQEALSKAPEMMNPSGPSLTVIIGETDDMSALCDTLLDFSRLQESHKPQVIQIRRSYDLQEVQIEALKALECDGAPTTTAFTLLLTPGTRLIPALWPRLMSRLCSLEDEHYVLSLLGPKGDIAAAGYSQNRDGDLYALSQKTDVESVSVDRLMSRSDLVSEQGYLIRGSVDTKCLHDLVIDRNQPKIDKTLPRVLYPPAIGTTRNPKLPKHQSRTIRAVDCRILAFYLPQFHSIPENDAWWGPGFTEWTNVRAALPRYSGHNQPRIPLNGNYYDLLDPQTLDQQAKLARRYGIEGFCFYHYRFGSKRLLEKPLDLFLDTPEIDIGFCLCFANESWTRAWDGREKDILIQQTYDEELVEGLAQDIIRCVQDKRYIRVHNMPLILVYRVDSFPNFSESAAFIRNRCHAAGVGDICIAMVESFQLAETSVIPEDWGCDMSVAFPPHGGPYGEPLRSDILKTEQGESVYSYSEMVRHFAGPYQNNPTQWPCIAPGWDNSSRRQYGALIYEGGTPGAFQAWAEHAMRRLQANHAQEERLLFVNSWNEWCEGTYIEPDETFGHSWLEALQNAQNATKWTLEDHE